MSTSLFPSISSSESLSDESEETISAALDTESTCESFWRTESGSSVGDEEDSESPGVPIPFMFPNSDDRNAAAATSRLASTILLVNDKVEKLRSIACLLSTQSTKSLNRRDSRGRSPLLHAIARDDRPSIKLLIPSPEIDLIARDRFGNTSLMYASGHGHRHILKLLLDELKRRSGEARWPEDTLTFLYAENYDQDTAFTIALARDHDDCIAVLSDYFKEAIYEDERRKCSLIYRLGVRGAAVARALTNIQLKNGANRFGRKRCPTWRKTNSSEIQIEETDDQNALPMIMKRRTQSQENVSRIKSTMMSRPLPKLHALIVTATPFMELAIRYGK